MSRHWSDSGELIASLHQAQAFSPNPRVAVAAKIGSALAAQLDLAWSAQPELMAIFG
jgi:hypothetical protein